jgi:hypothetical protein
MGVAAAPPDESARSAPPSTGARKAPVGGFPPELGEWSEHDVKRWVETAFARVQPILGAAQGFVDNGMNGQTLVDTKEEDLKQYVPFVPCAARGRLLSGIKQLLVLFGHRKP